MTFVLFEEAGKLQAGRLMSQAAASAQVELDSGKRLKLKAVQLLLTFEQPSPAQLLTQAQALAEQIDLELAWDALPEAEVGFADLAQEYFGSAATVVQQVAALWCLFHTPHYFRRAGKGRFKKAPALQVQQALAAIEKKQQQQALVTLWAQQLSEGICPDPVRQQLYKILFKPDKNALEYKAVVEATKLTHSAPLALLQRVGAIESAYQFHYQRFLFENFPTGTAFPSLTVPLALGADLPLADCQAFSIDDSGTTEIDDALSVQGLGSGTVTVGIHIAAPALLISPGDALDQVARQRFSTVYMPGNKITMLPAELVAACTLAQGHDCAVVSLYLSVRESDLFIEHSQTRLERVPIAANLRYDQLDHWVTPEWLAGPTVDAADIPQHLSQRHAELSFLYRLAQHWKAARELVRGKPESFSRPDYNFKLEGVGEHGPRGDEPVRLEVRRRGAPLDLIVAEAMIAANSLWGQWLAQNGVAAIYRSQASLGAGVKVRMGTRALPHAGIGVPCYAWSTSPLRRYTDLVNQWQIIACARHGTTAALAAPFKAQDAQLFALISGFEAAYAAYGAHQAAMERYWTLRYLSQHGINSVEATLIKDGVARLDTVPLVLNILGSAGLPRGARLLLSLGSPDEINLDLSATVVQRLDAADDLSGQGEGGAVGDEADDEGDADLAVAGPLTLALALDDPSEEQMSAQQTPADTSPPPELPPPSDPRDARAFSDSGVA